MIILVAFLIVVASVPLAGGRLQDVARLRVRWPLLIVATMVGQMLVTDVFADRLGGAPGAILHVVTYGFALLFLWLNRHIRGLWIVVAGGLMNFVAIAANGGVMPTTEWALETAGRAEATAESFSNSGKVDDARLVWLGDALAWPEPLPLHNVFSVGDVVLVVGVAYVLHTTCRRRSGSEPVDEAPKAAEAPPEGAPPLSESR
jgi:Family of unknown function (DUF5317)